MSISDYFRRSRKAAPSTEDSPVTVRAPQPVNEPFKKNLIKPKEKISKKSILYYLTPQPKTEPTKPKQEPEEEEHVVCKIKNTKPISTLWNTLLEEYSDPLAEMYSLPDARYHKKEISNNDMEIVDPNQANKRKIDDCKDQESDDEATRNVRVRRRSVYKLPEIEDYDDDEHLIRPLRFKNNLKETQKILLFAANQYLSSSGIL